MPTPDPSWDCHCGVRNAGTFFHCRRCSGPRPSFAPPRDPDEWTRIRIGTPLSYDIRQAVMGMVAAVGFLVLGYLLFVSATQ